MRDVKEQMLHAHIWDVFMRTRPLTLVRAIPAAGTAVEVEDIVDGGCPNPPIIPSAVRVAVEKLRRGGR